MDALCMTGNLQRQVGLIKSWKKYYCELRDNYLTCQSENKTRKSSMKKDVIDLRTAESVKRTSSSSLSFQIISKSGKTYTFSADSYDQAMRWLAAIETAMNVDSTTPVSSQDDEDKRGTMYSEPWDTKSPSFLGSDRASGTYSIGGYSRVEHFKRFYEYCDSVSKAQSPKQTRKEKFKATKDEITDENKNEDNDYEYADCVVENGNEKDIVDESCYAEIREINKSAHTILDSGSTQPVASCHSWYSSDDENEEKTMQENQLYDRVESRSVFTSENSDKFADEDSNQSEAYKEYPKQISKATEIQDQLVDDVCAGNKKHDPLDDDEDDELIGADNAPYHLYKGTIKDDQNLSDECKDSKTYDEKPNSRPSIQAEPPDEVFEELQEFDKVLSDMDRDSDQTNLTEDELEKLRHDIDNMDDVSFLIVPLLEYSSAVSDLGELIDLKIDNKYSIVSQRESMKGTYMDKLRNRLDGVDQKKVQFDLTV